MKKTLIAMLVSCFFLQGCSKKSSLKFSDGSSPSISAEEATFTAVKAQILNPHCITCHREVSTEKGLSAWVVAGHPDKSSFFTEIERGSMPKGGSALSTADLELVKVYIENLSSTGTTTPTPTPTTPSTGITYAQVKSRILTPYGCTSCHSVSTEAKLASWINVSSPAKSSFYTTVNSGSMPQGGSDLSASDKAFVLQYAKDFASTH